MGRVFISRTGFQFFHKLPEFVGCSCFFYCIDELLCNCKKIVYNSNLEIGNDASLTFFINSIVSRKGENSGRARNAP
jgi:hypothetical protein